MKAGINIAAAEQGALFGYDIARHYELGLDFITQSTSLEIVVLKLFSGQIFPRLETWNTLTGPGHSQAVFALIMPIT